MRGHLTPTIYAFCPNILANAQRGRDREAPARSIVLLTFEIEHE
jgi:hypothetical protein